MLSTSQMITKVSALVGTAEVDEWTADFIRSLVAKMNAGQVTQLSERQLAVLERLHSKHFA